MLCAYLRICHRFLEKRSRRRSKKFTKMECGQVFQSKLFTNVRSCEADKMIYEIALISKICLSIGDYVIRVKTFIYISLHVPSSI